MSQADNPNTIIASDVVPRPAKPRAKRIAPTKQRKLLENAIERLVELLDQIDPDPDLEDNGDSEPSLGWPIPQENLGHRLNTDADCRGDFGDDREHDMADDEPSLGWQNEGSQGRLKASRDDCEEQCEDEGAEHDGCEPEATGSANPYSAQYNTLEWRQHMALEFGETP
jgi:hypothetical protein